MRILQITNAVVCGPERVGKWYCSDSAPGTDQESVHRYLQADGTWGKNTHYFDTDTEIKQLLQLGHKPDFSLGQDELRSRQMLRDWQRMEIEAEDRWDDERLRDQPTDTDW